MDNDGGTLLGGHCWRRDWWVDTIGGGTDWCMGTDGGETGG